MGLISFLRCGTVGQYRELKRAKKAAIMNGEKWSDNAWLESKGYKGAFAIAAEAQQAAAQEKAENKKNGIVCCPKCGSTQLTANKKGFGGGKALLGAWATGGLGLLAGTIGSRKIYITCLRCGKRFKPGRK